MSQFQRFSPSFLLGWGGGEKFEKMLPGVMSNLPLLPGGWGVILRIWGKVLPRVKISAFSFFDSPMLIPIIGIPQI